MADATYSRYKQYRQKSKVYKIWIFIIYAVLGFVIIIPIVGKPLAECYIQLILALLLFISVVILQKRLDIKAQSEAGLLCPNCRPEAIFGSNQRIHLMNGECPRCLSEIGQSNTP